METTMIVVYNPNITQNPWVLQFITPVGFFTNRAQAVEPQSLQDYRVLGYIGVIYHLYSIAVSISFSIIPK